MAIKITEEQEQRVVELFKNGKFQKQISNIEGIAISTISKIIKKYGVKYERECENCKNVFIPKIKTERVCQNCKPIVKEKYKAEYGKKYREKNKNKGKPKNEKSNIKSLDDVLKIMREQGINYIDYQRMEMGI